MPVSCGVSTAPIGSGVDRAVGVAAGAFVDRADVQARRAADAVQCGPSDLVGQRIGAAVVEQDQVEVLRAVTRGDPGPQRGVRVHPLAGRGAGQQLQEHLEVAEGGQQLLDAHDGDQGFRQRQAHPAVALGLSTTHRVPVSAMPKFAPEIATLAVRNFRRRCARAAIASSRGSSVRSGGDAVHLVEEDLADLGPVAVDRGDQDVGGLVVAELDDEFGEIGFERGDAVFFEVLVEADLLGGHRFDLDDLVHARWRDDVGDDPVGLGGVGRPVHDAAAGGHVRLELLQQFRQLGPSRRS